MTIGLSRAGVTLFTGRFGSGKTEAALAYARALARSARPAGDSVVLVDLDIVTPYFRSREAADLLQREGIEVVAPAAVGRHLDTPALTPQILGAIQRPDAVTVLDVGGDRQGARAVGGYSQALRQRGYTLHFVVNPYRPFTAALAGVAASIAEIEASARLQVTSLVSNPNLKDDTTVGHILDGHARVLEFAERLGLPIAFVCVERRQAAGLGANHFTQPVLVLDRFLVQPWE